MNPVILSESDSEEHENISMYKLQYVLTVLKIYCLEKRSLDATSDDEKEMEEGSWGSACAASAITYVTNYI